MKTLRALALPLTLICAAAPLACGAPPAPGASPAAAAAAAAAADYGLDSLRQDLHAVLTNRPRGARSGQPLGNEQHRALWTDARLASLYRGIVNAQAEFYPELSVATLAHLVLAEAAQESTGDPGLGVRPVDLGDHRSQGLLQVTPGSVVLDFSAWGLPVVNAVGTVVLDPAAVRRMDLGEPRTNVMLWAWYTRNSLAAGVSLNEWGHRDAWHIPVGGVRRDYGNALFTWLAGPHNDRHVDGHNFVNYHDRIADYFVQSGFGSEAQFEALLATPLRPGMVLVHELR